MKILLTLKHWQIFLLTWGPPFIMSILFINSNNIPSWLNIITAFGCMMVLIILLTGSYIYTLGANLHKKLPDVAYMSLIKLKISLTVPSVYFLLLLLQYILGNDFIFIIQIPSFVAVLMSFFTMYCMFYSLYFVAKALVTVEKQTQVTFSNFAIEFFALWYFPLGIWVIQPRVNRIFGDKES